MKSKLHRLCDVEALFQAADPSPIPTAESVEEEVHRELTRGFRTYRPRDDREAVCQGDRVTLRVSSALPKYDREQVRVTVGSGLYDRALEEVLIGLLCGAQGLVTIQDAPVAFTILKVEGPYCPPLSDEMAQAKRIEGVDTVAQYRVWLLEKRRREALAALAEQLLSELALRSGLTVEPEDVRAAQDLRYARVRDQLLRTGTDLDSFTPEQWRRDAYNPKLAEAYRELHPEVAELCAAKSKEDYYAKALPWARAAVRNALLLCPLLGKDHPEEYDPTVRLGAEEPLVEEFTALVRRHFVKEE